MAAGVWCWLGAALKEKPMPSMAKAKRLMANRIKIMTLTALSVSLLGVSSAPEREKVL